MVEKLGETKDQYLLLMESFKSDMLKEHEKKEKEHTDFREVMDMLVNERDTAARDMVLEFERLKKHTIRGLGENPEQVTGAEKMRVADGSLHGVFSNPCCNFQARNPGF